MTNTDRPGPPLPTALAATIIAASLIALTGCASQQPAATQTPPPVAANTPVPQSPDRSLDDEPLALAMAPSLTWKSYHGTRLPFSDRWGPHRVSGDAATGFTHDPEGALVAMMQQPARLAAADTGTWLTVADLEAVIAPGDTTPTRRVSTGFDTTGQLPRCAAFDWLSYTPTRAVADLALQDNDGNLNSVRVTEIWTGTDWKTELPADGGPPAQPLRGLDTYQPWPGLP